MALRAELRENISQTKYLSAEHYLQHLSIMRLFFLEQQKMHYQLDKNTIFPIFARKQSFLNIPLRS